MRQTFIKGMETDCFPYFSFEKDVTLRNMYLEIYLCIAYESKAYKFLLGF